MTVRSASAAALLALSVSAFSFPADAQQIGTFNAWGNEFWVPGQQATDLTRSDVLSTGSISVPRGYTSAKVRGMTAPLALPNAGRTINVWGARIDVQAY